MPESTDITKNDNSIVVQTSLMPFKGNFDTLELKDCKTIREMVDKLVPYNFKDCNLIATCNGKIIDCEYWEVVELKKGDLVSLNVIPTGGGGGGKNAWQIVAMIAIVAVAWYFAPAAIGAIGDTLGVTANVATGIYVGTVSMVMSLTQSMLASTPKQSSKLPTIADSPTSFISGARNSASAYGIVPVNLGVNRMFPPLAAKGYVETNGNDQYCRQLFTYGYGKLVITDRKFGETSISNYENLEMEDRLNADLNQGTSLYTNDVNEEQLNVKLTQANSPLVRSTQENTSECEVDITFNGLVRIPDSGKYSGQKFSDTVDFDIQWAVADSGNWSTGLNGAVIDKTQYLSGYVNQWVIYWHGKPAWFIGRRYFIMLNIETGNTAFTYVDSFDGIFTYPFWSNDWVSLGYYENGSYHDLRYNLVGKHIKDYNSFVVTVDDSNRNDAKFTIGPGEILGTKSRFSVTASTTSQLRKTFRFKFPTPGKYDVRIRRLTSEGNGTTVINSSYVTAFRSISYTQPVKMADISGSALRIKATDQLNGAVDSYNCIVTTLLTGYNPETDSWEENKASSNPADIFRYVLQSPAFAKYKSVTDDKIDLEKLKEWWIYCNDLNLSYNRIIDYETSIIDVLNDICAAGVAALSKVNNIYSVIIDNERPIVKGIVTPRNSWDYSGSLAYSELPHAFRVEFRNSELGYETDERIVYREGYNENNSELYERLQFMSCTNSDLAYWYGRRYFATSILQPETHTFKMDFEYMTFNRGDRISLVNDVILVGVGQGRIKQLIVDSVNNPTVVKGFVIDDKLTIPEVKNLGVRIRNGDGKSVHSSYYLLKKPTTSQVNEFEFATPLDIKDAPKIESLCAFVEDGKELDLIITGIKPNNNQSATITAIDYAPERFKPLEEIPPFESNITLAADLYKPKMPELNGEIQTDESVMIRNSDGSLISVMIINLINRNTPDILPIIKCRLKGDTEWFTPSAIMKDANRLMLTGLQDGFYYDVEIRYQYQSGAQLISDPLSLYDVLFVGGSTPPKKVQNFRVTITNGIGFFEWAPNDDIDISHYIIRYSASLEDVTWEGSQVAMDKITSTSVTNIIHKGVYLIKAVDLLGNESLEATTIVSTDTGAFKNVVEEMIQQPLWLGEKDRVIASKGILYLDLDEHTEGYYYFAPNSLDLGDIYECSLRANVKAVFDKRDKIRDIDRIRNVGPIRNYNVAESLEDVEWGVELEMSLSDDGETWSEWETFVASHVKFRACKFRLHIWTNNVYVTPRVNICQVIVDMPDRYESGEDIEMENAETGAVVKYANPFWNNPAVNITIQDGDVDDRLEFIVKNNEGFTFKVFNATLNTYVKRSFDFLAAGYGRVVS